MHLRRETHLGRYYQIGDVLARHGLGYFSTILGLERFVPFRRNNTAQPSRPEYVRMALEELGATFIKLGQLLSTRSDLVPPEYLKEFAKLQDQAPPVAANLILETLLEEFGRPIEEVFANFDTTPLAAASIGQTHLATLLDGTEVVVKVRRPNVVKQVEEDLEILQNLATTASRRWEFANRYDLAGLAQEFAQTLHSELDYLREGHNAERFAANFATEADIHIPKVFWETTTSRVLTMERILGIKVNDEAALDASQINRTALAERATKTILKMIFEDGFFHADLHPGNLFIEPSGRIGLIDFGMVGTVDEHTQEQLARMFVAVINQDSEQLVDLILELGVARQRVDRSQLQRDLAHLFSSYYDLALSEIAINKLLEDTLDIVRRHNLQMPSNLVLLLKMVVMTEGMGTQLSPDFRLIKVLEPYARRLVMHQYSPLVWARRLNQTSRDAARLGMELPRQLRRLIGEIERGELEVRMRPIYYEPIIGRLERLANRIVLSILVAAFIIGMAIVLSAYRLAGWEQWVGTFFTFGFILASLIGMYLAWTIFRSNSGKGK
ncbi:MAG: AarF/ABC1/UbiB kinase family protein [Chloroflexota bacterium]|nr:AarF/ABC1/UbiB kinase family protein [Chloroflexota bacterium]